MQAAGSHLALAWVHYQRDDLVEASRYLDQAAAMSAADLQPVNLAVAILQARLQRARGDIGRRAGHAGVGPSEPDGLEGHLPICGAG